MASLLNKLENEGNISKSLTVQLPIGEEGEIIGFVPYTENNILSDKINCPPLGKAYVIGNRIIFNLNDKTYGFPIFKKISKINEDKLHLLFLYIPRLISELTQSKLQAYFQSVRDPKPNPWVNNIDRISLLDGFAYYTPFENEYLFETNTKFKGVAPDFVVVTRRIIQSTGELIYEIYDPSEIDTLDK